MAVALDLRQDEFEIALRHQEELTGSDRIHKMQFTAIGDGDDQLCVVCGRIAALGMNARRSRRPERQHQHRAGGEVDDDVKSCAAHRQDGLAWEPFGKMDASKVAAQALHARSFGMFYGAPDHLLVEFFPDDLHLGQLEVHEAFGLVTGRPSPGEAVSNPS